MSVRVPNIITKDGHSLVIILSQQAIEMFQRRQNICQDHVSLMSYNTREEYAGK